MKIFTVEADGGNKGNIPRLGYGNGYGSYAIDGGEPIKIEYGVPMSNNVAEISIIHSALEDIFLDFGASHVLVRSDSQTALSWIKRYNKYKDAIKFPFENVSYCKAAQSLVSMIKKHKSVEQEWRGRAKSVELFGH